MGKSRASRYVSRPHWRAVFSVPVVREGVPLGYVWASVGDDAAGFLLCSRSADQAGVSAEQVRRHWLDRLRSACMDGLGPIATLHALVGECADQACGGVPAGTPVRRARNMRKLHDLANPGAPYDGPKPPHRDAEEYFRMSRWM